MNSRGSRRGQLRKRKPGRIVDLHVDSQIGDPTLTDTAGRLTVALADRYRIEREIGAGGMATVYLAHDLRHGRKVAIKVLRPELGQSIGAERFLLEIQVAAKLSHPHIVGLLDSGDANGDLFYVMPHIDGESLRDRLTRDRMLPVAEASRFLREVADALAKAHKAGVVHRDIKPENILLADGHAMVADFGVAKAVSDATSVGGMTTAGTSLGTPAYMAPEQVAADPLVDHRADLYSLGLVAYEMLTGRSPYDATTPQQQMAAHLSQVPAPLSSRRADCPPALAALVMQCLAKDPAARPPDASAIVTRLENLGAASARAPRARLIAILAAVSLVVVVAGALVSRNFTGKTGPAWDSPTRLAVLPFENLGAPDDAYFADGISDEIRGKLAGLGGLEVIASRSSELYRATTKSWAQIGKELDVQYILTGRIRWAKSTGGTSRVQISPELIVAATGTTRWQEPFDVTLNDIFTVQGQVAQRVAEALSVSLATNRNLGNAITSNLAAYDHFLRGGALLRQGQDLSSGFLDAASELEKAVALDSAFALAWANLAFARAGAYWFFEDRSERGVELARQAAQRALDIDPKLADGHAAFGYIHYWCRRDYEPALVAFNRALERAPGHIPALRGQGLVFRRQGRFEESVVAFMRAAELDPQNSANTRDVGSTLTLVGRELESLVWFERQVALAPSVGSYVFQALALLKTGKVDEGARALDAASQAGSPSAVAETLINGNWLLFAPIHRVGAWPMLGTVALTPAIDDTAYYYLAKATFAHITGDSSRARLLGDSATRVLRAHVERAPEEPRSHLLLGQAHAFAGRREPAIAEGRKALDLLPISRDALDGSTWMKIVAHTYVLVGDHDAAITLIGQHLATKTYFGPASYGIDLRFSSLRGDPRFQQLTGQR